MIAMNRPGIAIGLLLSLGLTRSMLAQTSGSTPPPPPPGRVASPTLEGPVTDLEPIRPDDTAVQNSRSRRAGFGCSCRDPRRAARQRWSVSSDPSARSPATAASDRRAAVRPTARSAPPLGCLATGIGIQRGQNSSGSVACGKYHLRARCGSPPAGGATRSAGIVRRGSGAAAAITVPSRRPIQPQTSPRGVLRDLPRATPTTIQPQHPGQIISMFPVTTRRPGIS